MTINNCGPGDEVCDSCNAASEANGIMESLNVEDLDLPPLDIGSALFTFPGGTDSAMYKDIPSIGVSDLTTRTVKGDGAFDAMMESFSVHLKEEYTRGRITGAEYSKAYTALAESAMQGGITFLLGKDQAFWQSQISQLQALTARVQFETAKAALVAQRAEALSNKASYALTKLKLATEEATYCTAVYNLTKLMPEQKANLITQGRLLYWQTEAACAQTSDTHSELGGPIQGILGKQKELYAQQIISYQRDSEYKAAKVFTDAWVAQKTIDEGLLAPTNFTNASVDAVLTKLKTNNGLS